MRKRATQFTLFAPPCPGVSGPAHKESRHTAAVECVEVGGESTITFEPGDEARGLPSHSDRPEEPGHAKGTGAAQTDQHRDVGEIEDESPNPNESR
jgi:hypothetical protein